MNGTRRLPILLAGWVITAASQTTPLVAASVAVVTEAGQATGTAHAGVLPFIEDDYSRALAEAQARQLPLFIESWAPW